MTRPINRSVEGLRGVAALLVVISHCLAIGGFTLGVDLFFVLSGFLITRLLVGEIGNNGRIALARFYIRRGFRLLPALVLFLLAVLTWGHLRGDAGGVASIHGTVLSSLLYVENWHILSVGTATPSLLVDPATHTWSLSIEEQFYLLWPVLLIAGWRWKGARGALILAVCGVALATVDRLGLAGTSLIREYFSTDTRADQLLAGCCVALLSQLRWLPRIPRGLSVAALGTLLAIGIHPFALPYQMTATAVLGAVLVAGLSQHQLGALSGSWVVWLGGRSYALYLWHPLVRAALHDSAHLADGGVMFVAVMAVSLVVSDLTFRIVERPLRDLGRRLTSAPPLPSAGPQVPVAVIGR
ncbi:MAG TPA: acyltransferase [Candidatus Dormibacteraeota bacterium]